MAKGTYIFDGGATSYFTTGHDLNATYTEYSLVFKCAFNAGFSTVIGGSLSGQEVYQNGDQMTVRWGNIAVDYTNTGHGNTTHTYVLRYAVGDSDSELFRDGISVQLGGAPISIPFAVGSDLFLGAFKAANGMMQGGISHIYGYNRKLTNPEIAAMQVDISDNPQTNKLFEYKDNKTLATWTDDSGNGIDATNAGGVTFVEDPPTTTRRNNGLMMILKRRGRI